MNCENKKTATFFGSFVNFPGKNVRTFDKNAWTCLCPACYIKHWVMPVGKVNQNFPRKLSMSHVKGRFSFTKTAMMLHMNNRILSN